MKLIKMLAIWAIGIVIILLSIALVVGFWRSWVVMHDAREQVFVSGKLPSTPLDGFISGSVQGLNTDWQGKKFDSSSATGINVFKTVPNQIESFPFKTYSGFGLQDKKLEVLKIDYDNPINPWWVRRVVDELVEIEPGQYLGKIHLKITPGVTFTVGYFRLNK